ncbi:AMP-binding protein [uncultured Vagococcus sp.]|uniref:amino acid adenylation domain-containing protein n=1 Tax=uncultured Vagococcus sp. TaxID=189676 RepID=UPI0028D52920|nr:AMP-binding protein [uncultured Vagococcus sp.]
MKKVRINQLQKQLFTHYQKYPKDPSYNIVYSFHLSGMFNKERMKAVLEQLMNTEEILKVNFISEDDATYMKHDSAINHSVEVRSIDALSTEDFLENIREIASNYHKESIDLEQDKLIRINLYWSKQNVEDYAAICVVSHIIADAYSFYSFLEKAATLYNSKLDEQNLSLLIEDVRTDSYLSLTDDAFVSSVTKLEKTYTNLGLPEITQKKKDDKLIGRNLQFEIVNYDEIQNILTQYSVSPFVFFLSVHAIVISKILNKETISIGIPLANRNKKTRKIFGYFVNTLPIEIDFSIGDDFPQVLATIKKNVFLLLKKQNADNRQILSLENDKINNCFTFYKNDILPKYKDCTTNIIDFNHEYIQFELTSTVTELDNRYQVNYELGTFFESFELEKIYKNVLANILKGEVDINSYSFYDSKDIHSEVERLNSGSVVQLEDDCLFARFEKNVRKAPDKIAILHGSRTLTFRGLKEKVNKYSHWLITNWPCDKNIVVSIKKSIDLVALSLAIIQAKKVYIPIPEEVPLQRKEDIFHDLKEYKIIDANVLESMDKTLGADDFSLDCHHSENKIAYIIYTSGTTGKPKGVPISRSNLHNMLDSVIKTLGFSSKEVWAFAHSFSFDASIWEMYVSLFSGAKLVVVDDRIKKSPRAFRNLLMKNNVTVLTQTPTAFKLLKEVEFDYQNKLSIKYMLFASESFQFSILDSWIKKYPLTTQKIFNLYGPSESTVISTFYEVSHDDIEKNRANIIGKPLPHIRSFVVDERSRALLPKGFAGELAIGGPSITSGYKNNQILNDKKFVKLSNGENVYLSGDKVKILDDYQIEFLGRTDRQHKIRGFRVECGEVETVFENYFKGGKSVVDCIQTSMGISHLVIYYVYDEEISQKLGKNVLRKMLPDYMIPTFWIKLSTFPLTANGKINFLKLRDHVIPYLNNEERSVSLEGKSDEEKVSVIISEAVEHNDFNLDDDLVNIGINSIHIPRIYNTLVDVFELKNFDIADMFELGTGRDILKMISEDKIE